ncbi:helix-turn-helix domain-containing protein [Clostridium sp. D33t1_170424_F3]|uniref:helix-turn-helix transcriptional regulator n=1 Tax=Clostridium sp. D33t1_170424_F3 TaxID=2787099 RepID=UPI0018ABC4AE
MREKLVKLREAAGYTQETFSKAIGISRSHYSQIETGEKDPSLKVSLKIKRKLGYDRDDIFFTHKSPVSRRAE